VQPFPALPVKNKITSKKQNLPTYHALVTPLFYEERRYREHATIKMINSNGLSV
jgi:hypothetical protein